MSDDRVITVDDVLLERLDEADLPKEAYDLVLTTVLGEGDADAAHGDPPATPPAGGPRDVAGAYLTSIAANGFRGIGEPATLELFPGPGLTIVTGRNGSGKSSFAEAAELALTGANQRWASRTDEWRDGWRNLHTTGERYIRVGLGLDGHRGGGTIECHWAADADLDDGTSFLQRHGERRRPVADLGWDQPMQLYRPFLPYAELGALLSGRPSERYDSLHRVLGLDRLADIERRLKDARRDADQERGRANEQLPGLRQVLAEHPSSRAREVEELLGDIRSVDLDRLDAVATATDGAASDDSGRLRAVETLALPDRDQVSALVERLRDGLRCIADLAQTPAARARTIADLLQRALSFHGDHPDEPCPVCGGRTLDTGWAEQARGQVQQLLNKAAQVDQAHRAVRQAVAELRESVPTTPVVLATGSEGTESQRAGYPDGVNLAGVREAWRSWDHLLRSDDPQRVADEAPDRFDALAAALNPVREAARQALHARQQAWQPVADQVRAWTDTARASRLAADRYAAARKAVEWLRGVGERIRNDQLAPLAAEAAEIWRLLRQNSNVDLGVIQLAGTGNRRRVDLNVAVDGEPGAALGVMSQGELHALALSLFLPRATLAASPFRFLIIDDPVQSMDPAKVHGLAKVLERVAKRKQVIVFTHDDRLPTAIRHLGIKAHLRVVSRRERSQVSVDVDRHGDPALRYLDDAAAVAKDEQVDLALRTKVACVLVRDAIEARCHDVVIARGLRAARPIAEVEQQLAQVTRVREALALALMDDAAREPELDGRLRQLHPRALEVVKAANRGSHPGRDTGSVITLISHARDLVDRLELR